MKPDELEPPTPLDNPNNRAHYLKLAIEAMDDAVTYQEANGIVTVAKRFAQYIEEGV